MAFHQTALSPELTDLIIDELQDDKDSLRNCALVCRQFVARCRKHLFCTVDLVFSTNRPRHDLGNNPACRLLEVLNKDLGYYIRHLCIINYTEYIGDENHDRHTTDPDVLRRLFESLHRLHSFTFSVYHDFDSSLDHILSRGLVEALVRMFHATRVREISMYFVDNFPIALLAYHCPNVRNLKIEKTYWIPDLDDDDQWDVKEMSTWVVGPLALPTSNNIDHTKILEINKLSYAYVRRLYHAAKLPRAELTFSHLRSIDLRGAGIDALQFITMVAGEVGGALESFYWDYNHCREDQNYFQPDRMFFTLPPSLRLLWLAFIHDHDKPPLHLDWLCATLKKNSGRNKLYNITIYLKFLTFPADLNTAGSWDNSSQQLSVLDSLLTCSKYKHLRRVTIATNYASRFEDTVGACLSCTYWCAVEDMLKKKLPLLEEKGLLFIE